MKTILSLLAIAFSTFSFGQHHKMGLNIGPTFASVDRDGYDYYKGVSGFYGEGFYTYQKKHLVAKGAAFYQNRGYSQGIIYTDENGTILGEGAIEKMKYGYSGLTGLVGLEYGTQLIGYFAIGGSMGYYLKTKVSSEQFELDDGAFVPGYTYSFKNLEKIDFSAVAEIGFGVKIQESELFLITQYSKGLKKIRYDSVLTVDPWINNNLTFTLGFRISLDSGEKE